MRVGGPDAIIMWARVISDALAATAPFLMVILTGFYVFLTWKIVQSNHRLVVASARPVLVIEQNVDARTLALLVRNVGPGPAMRVQAHLLFSSSKRSPDLGRTLDLRSIGAGGCRSIQATELAPLDDRIEYDKLEIKLAYFDIYHQRFRLESAFDWLRRDQIFVELESSDA